MEKDKYIEEGYCNSCSNPIPKAFENEEEDNEIHLRKRHKEYGFNFCNIIIFLILLIVIYLAFFKK